MSQYLQQTRRESRGQYKYSVDCDKIREDPESLQVLNGDVRAKHTMVINAVVKETYGKVVVKIGKTNDIVKKEYDVAKRLEPFNGFIKMHCLFSCHNATNLNNINTNIYTTNFELCKPNEPENVDVLVMPYIHDGTTLNSLLNTKQDPKLYKNMLIQVITNLYDAFTNTGFVHKDLHFGNILIDENNKPIIMDFDTSEFNGRQSFFWADIQRLFNNAMDKSYLTNNISYVISNISGIQTLIHTTMFVETPTHIFQMNYKNMLSILEASDIHIIDNTNTKPKSYVYDPNVFGGKTRKLRKQKV